MFPVYEFRPIPDFFRGEFRRFADGAWVLDDGEYDLAFIGDAKTDEGWSYPCCLYFDPPYQRNIICSWLTTHWTGAVKNHPRNNPWHYALREGETEWGGNWGRDRHLNSIAGRKGMEEVCSKRRCANGSLVEMHANDPHIKAGLLRERESKKVFVWPQNLTCMYCGAAAPVQFKAEAA